MSHNPLEIKKDIALEGRRPTQESTG